jgi:hypothetical protein
VNVGMRAAGTEDTKAAGSLEAAMESGDAEVEAAVRRPTYVPLAAADVPIYRRYWGEPGAAVSIEELERTQRFSRLRSELPIDRYVALLTSRGFAGEITSEAHQMAIGGFARELACYRDFEYWFLLAGQDESELYVFLTNDETTPIATLLGEHYSHAAASRFAEVGYSNATNLVQWDRRYRDVTGRRHCRYVSDPIYGMDLPP